MEYDELEPVPDRDAVAMTAMAMCAEAAAEAACLRQVPELAEVADDLDDDDWTAEILAEDCRVLDADEESGAWGYVETERGAVFTGFPWDADAEDDQDQDEDTE